MIYFEGVRWGGTDHEGPVYVNPESVGSVHPDFDDPLDLTVVDLGQSWFTVAENYTDIAMRIDNAIADGLVIAP